jgi:hypothetical protein
MTHSDFLKWESGLSDILASAFRFTSELGSWMTSIHWVITNIYPQGVANHGLTCIYFYRRKPSIASMNNFALWPYFSPSYLHLGVEWFYLVPPLFLAHTCNGLTSLIDTLVISKCIWQFICNIVQINNSLNSTFSSFSTWSWAWNVLCIPNNFLALYMVHQISP